MKTTTTPSTGSTGSASKTTAYRAKHAGKDRQAMIAKIHIAKKQLHLDDASYRDLLYRLTRHESCGEMTLKQLDQVLDEMRRLGFKPVAKHGSKPRVAQDRQALLDKVEAILAEKQLHWNYARAMAKTMFDRDAIEWLNERQLYKLVQALAVYQQRQR